MPESFFHFSRKCLLFLILSLPLSLSLLRPDDFFAVKDRVIAESRFKFASLYFTPLFMLENVGYNSNIFTYYDQAVPDWTGDLGVGLRASAIVANRLILQAEDLPHYSYYLENENLRSWSNRFQAAVYSYIGPLNFKAGFVFNDLTQRPYDEFSRPFQYTKREWSGEVDWGRRSKLFLTAYTKFGKLAYDEDPYLETYRLAEILNRQESSFGLKLNRRIFTSTIIYLNYQLSDYVFTANSERDSSSQAISLGVELPEIGLLQGGFQIGLNYFDPKNPLFKPSQNLNGSGNVRVTLFKRLRLKLFYTLGTNFSFAADDLYYNNQVLGGGADLYLTSFLKIGATYQEGRLNYHSWLDLELKRTDWTSQQQYFLAVPFLGNASFGMAYTIYRLRSDASNLDYTRSFWGGFVSYEF